MKKTLLSLSIFLLSFGLSAQCSLPVDAEGISTGEGNDSGVPVAPVNCAVNDGSNINSLIITDFSVQPNADFEYSLIISKPIIDPEGNLEGEIMGISSDGSFDFSYDYATDAAFPPDVYSFTSFIYKQEDLDILTAAAVTNPVTSGLGFVGGETLEEVIELIRTEPAKGVVELLNGGPITVEDFLTNILPLIADVLGTDPLCVDWATGDQVYEVTVYDNADDCDVTINTEDIIANELSIYPNPASNFTNISFQSNTSGEIQINIFDLTGKQISSINEFIITGENHIPVGTEELQSGVYLLQISGNDFNLTKRLTISK